MQFCFIEMIKHFVTISCPTEFAAKLYRDVRSLLQLVKWWSDFSNKILAVEKFLVCDQFLYFV